MITGGGGGGAEKKRRGGGQVMFTLCKKKGCGKSFSQDAKKGVHSLKKRKKRGGGGEGTKMFTPEKRNKDADFPLL